MSRHGPRNLAFAFAAVLLCLLGASIWIEMTEAEVGKRTVGRERDAEVQPGKEALFARTHAPFIDVLQEGKLRATFQGNGVNELSGQIENLAAQPLAAVISAGTIFTTADGSMQVVTTADSLLSLDAGKAVASNIPSASLRLSNRLGQYNFFPSQTRLSALDRLWPAFNKFDDASPDTIQTAILLMMEDPLLAHLARFKLSPSEKLEPRPPDTFRVDTQDLIIALIIVTDVAPEKSLKLFDSAQLRLEALINPKSHDAALMLYNIDENQEWDFWRTELLHGEPATRHYALYGIARYYPDIAFEMLPRWIQEKQAPLLFRQHAAYALAEIPREEVVRILLKLEASMNNEPALQAVIGKAASLARERTSRM